MSSTLPARDETEFIGARVPKHLADALEALATRNDRSKSAELRFAIARRAFDEGIFNVPTSETEEDHE